MLYNKRNFAKDLNTLMPVIDTLFRPVAHKTDHVADAPKRKMKPKSNIIEHEDRYEIVLAIPGFDKKDIKLQFENKRLTVSGELAEQTSDINYKHREWSMDSFERTFILSDKIDADAIKASFNSGILTISLAKVPEAQPKQIEIA